MINGILRASIFSIFLNAADAQSRVVGRLPLSTRLAVSIYKFLDNTIKHARARSAESTRKFLRAFRKHVRDYIGTYNE